MASKPYVDPAPTVKMASFSAALSGGATAADQIVGLQYRAESVPADPAATQRVYTATNTVADYTAAEQAVLQAALQILVDRGIVEWKF